MKTVLLAISLFTTSLIHAQVVDPRETTFVELTKPFFDNCKTQFKVKQVYAEYVSKWKRTLVVEIPGQFNNFKEFEVFAKQLIVRGSVTEIAGHFTTKFVKYWETQLTLNYVINAKGPNDINYGYAEVEP